MSTIKSLTTKIGADTSDFLKEMKKVDKELKTTQKSANELQKGLEIQFDSSRFVQAQKQVQSALSQTEEKAEAIRRQLKYLEDTGQVDTEGYQKLQAELAKTETSAVKLRQQLEDIDKIKLDNLTKGVDEFAEKADKAGKALAGVSVAAAGALVGMGKLAQDARQVGDDIATNAQKYDMSTDAIQRWEYVAMQSDLSAQTLFKSMTKVRSAFGEQITGNITAASRALEYLGLNIKDFDNNEDAFQATIQALASIEDKATQAAYANDIFGKRMASDVIPLLQQGQDAIASYLGEFEQVGYLSEEQVNKLAELDNELNMVNARFEQAKLELGVALIPVLEVGADLLTTAVVPAVQKLASWFGNLDQGTQKMIITLLGFVAVLSPLLIVVGKVSTGISALIKLFATLNMATIKTTAGFMALAGALALGVNLIANWSEMTTLQKVLNSLAVGALAAAAAFTVFHASASVGIAVGAITAGITAGLAAINAAKKKIMPNEPDIEVSGIGSGTNIPKFDNKVPEYKVPELPSAPRGDVITDNSHIEVNVTLQPTGELGYDAKELADQVIKEIVIQKQALGR